MSELSEYVDLYREAIVSSRYAELPELQNPPYPSLFHGGAGTAYVLWRLGETRRARTWITAALAERRANAYDFSDLKPPRSAFMFGRSGGLWVRALLANKRGAESAAFARSAARAGDLEFMVGAAGTLTGSCLLLARFEDPTVRRTASKLAASLCERMQARAWQPLDSIGFAHYAPGALFALLSWAQLGNELPALPAIARSLLAVWSPEVVRSRELHGSWCNGLAGAIMVWAKAFVVLGDEAYLAASRAAGRALLVNLPRLSDLCCGRGGSAYALRTLEAIDPGQGWRERALEIGAGAIAQAALLWPNGLYRGHPGLVCLAIDLETETLRGFPALEA